MKLKRIVIFYPSFEKGGVEKILINLIKYFINQRIFVSIISTIPKNELPKSKLLNLIKINKSKPSFLSNRVNKALIASKLLKSYLEKNNSKDTIVFSLQSSSLAIMVSKYCGFKIVARNAEDPIYSTLFADERVLSIITLLSKIFTYNFADGIITNSIGSKNSLNKILFNKHKTISIYNPYLSNIYRYNSGLKKNFILSVGRLTKQKDHKTLIRAIRVLNEKKIYVNLKILGDGELKKDLKNLVEELQLNKQIKFYGWKKNTTIFFKRAKLFVLSSLYEGFGNVLVDAINYQVPIITTNCKSGPTEIILNNKGGFITPVSDAISMAKTINYCLKNYDIAKKKAKFSKKNIHRFLIEPNSKKYFNYLKKIFNETN